MNNPGSRGPAETGVGPSVVGRWLRDRSLRIATGLAVAVAIPVALLFYFQFRSLSDLGRSSSVVLRQLSHETADGITRSIEDTLKTAYIEVILRINQGRTEPLDLPFIQETFDRSLAKTPFLSSFYIWS